MTERITKRAFPHLQKALRHGEQATDKEIRAAVHAELQQLVNADWRQAARAKRKDIIGEIAHQLRAPVRQVENILRRAGKLDATATPPATADIHQLGKRPTPRKRKK
jgi:hypothetical protein